MEDKDKASETLLKSAEELIKLPDIEIMARSLGKNDRHADNYQMAMNIKLKNSISNLKRSMDISSWITGGLTFILIILTIMLVVRG
jgi:hypothetical protein